METGFLIAAILLIAFALLGLIDGIYLHLIKYRLFQHSSSKKEHFVHAIRSLLFPLIVYFLFVNQAKWSFFLGLGFTLIDILVLGFDAYMEKDSREFMGGLPRWEYILHLFANSFHFAAIAVFLAMKLDFQQDAFALRLDFEGISAYEIFQFVAKNIIPGAIMTTGLHFVLMLDGPAKFWNKLTARIG